MAERLAYPQEIVDNNPESAKINLDAEFIGFNPEQAKRVKNRIESYGMPLDKIKTITYRPNKHGQESLIGSWTPHNGDLSLYKSMENLPFVAQDETMSHETGHTNSPFDPENDAKYGPEAAAKARQHAADVALQALETGVYINGYHKALAENYMDEKIDDARYLEETFAIMVGQRFTNPKHLEQVEKAMGEKAEDQGLKSVEIKSGIDETLVALMPAISSKEELDKHITNLRKSADKEVPILPNENLPLAA